MHLTVIVRLLFNMTAHGCVLHRTLTRSKPAPNQVSSPIICRDVLRIVDIRRYTRDQTSPVYFPQTVLSADDLYDVTLTDEDCLLQLTLDPCLNRLVERRVLQPGSAFCNASFSPTLSAQLPECPGASRDSYRLVSLQVRDEGRGEDDDTRVRSSGWDSLPWFGSSEPTGPLVPLRANRVVFLPLWNSVDYSGEVWREAPPTEGGFDDDDEEDRGRRPGVTVSELRNSFLSGRGGVARGAVQHQLIVRIISKSHLMYYGRTDRNCECPYKVFLQVNDCTGSVCVVLWNSVCVNWYRCVKPGDIISLRHYRVKRHYQAQVDDIEISVNSRNPAAQIAVLPESSVSPEHLPPAPTYSFCSSKDLLELADCSVCDVIGLLTFTGRSERVRSRDSRGAELREYRWLRLEDGSSSKPIMVKLFSTSQPEAHLKLHPLSVVVCTRLTRIRCDRGFYLTNSAFTQVYCTGLGHHSQMSYRRSPQVKLFLQWLGSQEDAQVLSRALIGGFFIHPPPPVSLETYMKERRGEMGFLQGAELQRELERLCYRERHSFCIQATVTMVTYSLRGKEDRCLFWMDRASSLSSPSPQPPSSPPSLRPSSSPSFSPASAASTSTPHPSDHTARTKRMKRKMLLQDETPKKRRPQLTVLPEDKNKTVILFETSMEFLESPADEDDDDDDDDDDDTLLFSSTPTFPSVHMETLPMKYNYTRREEQAATLAMEGTMTSETFDPAHKDYYTLRLRALSDGLLVDAFFLPHLYSSSPCSSALHHSNTWTSILSHGAFSSNTPPPHPADLIAMAAQLTNQRLVCVLEACHLGGSRTELVLVRAFCLNG
nr:RPA-related protein RADX [Nothobranchius furzeri]